MKIDNTTSWLEERSVLSGGRRTGWLRDVAVVLWRRVLGMLGDVNIIENGSIHQLVFQHLNNLFTQLFRVSQFPNLLFTSSFF